MPKVSIIIATRNRAQLLPRAIESARRSGGDLEVVVVDDASTDATAEVCSRFSDVLFVPLTRHTGLAGARNAGIRACTGDYIAFLDDDDIRLPDSLPEQVQLLEAQPNAAFVYGQVILGDENCAPAGPACPAKCLTGDVFWELVKNNFVLVNSVVVRRSPLFAVGLFDPALRRVEDWDLWIRLSERWPVVAVPKPVAVYRNYASGSGQLSSDQAQMCQITADVQARGLKLPRAMSAPAAQRHALRHRLLRILWRDLLSNSIRFLIEGTTSEARKYLRTAFRLRPFQSVRSDVFRRLWISALRSSGRSRLNDTTASRLREKLSQLDCA